MPWKETVPMDQRVRFIAAVSASGGLGMTEACQLFGISRKSGYKWLERYKAGGPAALEDRSRAPRTTPWAVDAEVSSVLVAARKAHPTWGPVKLLDWLAPRQPNMRLPAPSSVGDLLKRKGPTHEGDIVLPSVPGGLEAIITPRLRKPSDLIAARPSAVA